MVYGGRAGGILSIPAQEVSLGSPRVGTIDVQSPTPRTPPLQASPPRVLYKIPLMAHLLERIASALAATNRDALLCFELGRFATRYDTLIRRRPGDGEAGAGRTPASQGSGFY